MEKRVCKKCGREKNIESFYRCATCPQGRQTHCKICQSAWNKQYREKHPVQSVGRELKMTNVGLKDYCQTYKLLIQMGYDPTGNVAEQFSNKYGTKYKDRKNKDLSTYSFGDCLKSYDREYFFPNTDLLD